MDQFEYVMVLVSIIVGLGIARGLLGVGGIIDRPTVAQESPIGAQPGPCRVAGVLLCVICGNTGSTPVA